MLVIKKLKASTSLIFKSSNFKPRFVFERDQYPEIKFWTTLTLARNKEESHKKYSGSSGKEMG